VTDAVLGGRYELLEKIGEGGMSVVYKARCRLLERTVAIKILKDEFSKDQSFVERFKIEALAAAKMSHPNIVNIYDVGQQNDTYYIVMEYVEGESLKDIINRQAPLSVQKAIDIAVMICEGINHAHEKGIIHRDIKPHNILITGSGIVKVADFGIAQAISMKTITYGGDVFGSVHYISPEQAKGNPVSRATDIYSLGCVLYEMLTGKVPFETDSPITMALKHIHDDPIPPSQINEEIPAALERITLKAMEKVPEHRYSTAEEFKNQLVNLGKYKYSELPAKKLEDKTIELSPIKGEGSEGYLKKKRQKRIKPKGVLVIMVALVGLVTGFFYANGSIFGQEVSVPNIEGKTITEAKKELAELDLILEVIGEQASERYAKDEIVSQNPASGQKVKEGRKIEVILSKGSDLKKVPNLVGLDFSSVEIYLRNEQLELGIVDKIYDARYPVDTVISQSPSQGKMVKEGTGINVMVSKGEAPQKVTMPSLIGLSLDESRTKLHENNLILGDIKKIESTEYFADQVIEQDIEAGVLVDEQSSIILTISKGPGPEAHTKVITFDLPKEQDNYKVVANLSDIKGEREVYNQLHKAGDTVYLGVTFFGEGNVQILLNDQKFQSYDLW